MWNVDRMIVRLPIHSETSQGAQMYKSVLSDLFGTLIAPPPMDMYRKIVGDVADTLGVTFEILNDPRMSISDRLLTWGGTAAP
ncbi:MAG: hypothetical protein CL726_07050 [Chloroflexi bacterium]|nr:hypothetical protein [Chloroflexota bacterium]